MGPRQFWEKYSRKWTAYVVLAFLSFTIVIHVGHFLKVSILEKVRQDVLSETLGVASFFLIFLLLEEVFAGAEKLETASAESRQRLDLASAKLDDLSKQVESTTGIASYAELSVFKDKWENLRDNFETVTLVGELPINYGEEVRSICEKDKQSQPAVKEKELSIYRSLNTRSKKEINELLESTSQANPDLVQVYHMYGFEWGSWAMGRSNRGDETEVLLNYASPHGDALAGLHLSGKAADSFVKAITPHFNEVGLPGVGYPPVRLASREQVEFIIEEKVQYQKKIKEMVELGVPVEGMAKICEAMTKLLRGTRKTLDVTHLCADEGAIERLQDEVFQKWVEANYSAKERGVTIRRIFIVGRERYGHEILRQVMQEMREKKIEVLLCPLDALRERYKEDFSLYDDQHVVYMDRARSYWSGKQEPLARCTESRGKIGEYRDIFDSLVQSLIEI